MQALKVKRRPPALVLLAAARTTPAPRVPEGSRAMAGIGCHYMAVWMDRSTITFTQMGGEGVPWVGQAPFTTDKHIFANLGDGTYFHSGLLAIRQSIAAGVNITYKILYNDAVAMTGGQQVGERPEGHSVLQIMQSLVAEGVSKLVIVTDEPEKYDGVALQPGVDGAPPRRARPHPARVPRAQGHHGHHLRPDLRHREAPPPQARHDGRPGQARGDQRAGVRRLRRLPRAEQLPVGRAGGDRVRPQAPHQPEHLQQGLLLREGLLPELRHRRRRQAEEAARRTAARPSLDARRRCPSRRCRHRPSAWGIVVAGVGGTGVITIGQLLGMAAHIEGKGIVTQDAGGLAQKGGATWSHVQIADTPDAILTTKVGTAEADLVIGCDPIVAASKDTLAAMREGRTYVALNTHGTPTAAFVQQPRLAVPRRQLRSRDRRTPWARRSSAAFDAEQLAVRSCWATRIYTNPLMLGYAWQQGWVPLAHDVADARDRAQRRAGRQQQGRLRMGPARRARPGRGAGPVAAGGAGDRSS